MTTRRDAFIASYKRALPPSPDAVREDWHAEAFEDKACPRNRRARIAGVTLVVSIIAAFAVALFGIVSPARSQPIKCVQAGQFFPLMKTRYSEVPVSVGVINANSLLVVLASPSGTFTVVVRNADGVVCLVITGNSYEPGTLPVVEGEG